MSWTAVAFYTSEYAQYVASWTSMIRALGGTPVIVHRESTGDWARNTGLKPQAILQAFAQVSDPWFLYLDIDVSIEVPPSAPAGAWDVGVTRNLVMTHKNRVSAATLLFNKTPGAKRFLEVWAARCRARPGKDHDHLTHTIGVFRGVSRRERVVDVDGRIVWTPNGLRDLPPGAPVAPAPTTASVWYAIPSIRPTKEAQAVLNRWRARGYKVAVQRDPGAGEVDVDLCVTRPYAGYAEAVNFLALKILAEDPHAQWVVTGGDDLFPDPTADPEKIARECENHFEGTLGIMQPTGDRHLQDAQGRCSAERVCISPWMGREWCENVYNGGGPLCAEYFHFFVDEELHEVAQAMGRLWHRRDITQHHGWWSREGRPAPQHFLREKSRWEEAKNLFSLRKASGFPGSFLLCKK